MDIIKSMYKLKSFLHRYIYITDLVRTSPRRESWEMSLGAAPKTVKRRG